jgi:hypothetical protein
VKREILTTVSPLLLSDLALKAALIALLLVPLVWPDLPQFDGDSHSAWRALTYPICLVVVPAGWSAFRRRTSGTYPYELDLLLPVPLLLDAAAPTLYHRVDWWDKLMHVVAWSTLSAACVLLLSRRRVRYTTAAALAAGFGLLTAVLWELWEYAVWVRNSPELMQTEFSDTSADLLCDVAAIALGLVVTLLLTTRRERSHIEPATTAASLSR